MSFFDFELSDDCLSKTPIELPDDLKGKIPDDYAEFLTHYEKVSIKDNMIPLIHIDGVSDDVQVRLLTLNRRRLYGKKYPDSYTIIASDGSFESIFMSLREEDFAHIYYLDDEMWNYFVLHEDEEVQLNNIKKYATAVASSFSEFTHKLHEDIKS